MRCKPYPHIVRLTANLRDNFLLDQDMTAPQGQGTFCPGTFCSHVFLLTKLAFFSFPSFLFSDMGEESAGAPHMADYGSDQNKEDDIAAICKLHGVSTGHKAKPIKELIDFKNFTSLFVDNPFFCPGSARVCACAGAACH